MFADGVKRLGLVHVGSTMMPPSDRLVGWIDAVGWRRAIGRLKAKGSIEAVG